MLLQKDIFFKWVNSRGNSFFSLKLQSLIVKKVACISSP